MPNLSVADRTAMVRTLNEIWALEERSDADRLPPRPVWPRS